jgi:hypothetical protein
VPHVLAAAVAVPDTAWGLREAGVDLVGLDREIARLQPPRRGAPSATFSPLLVVGRAALGSSEPITAGVVLQGMLELRGSVAHRVREMLAVLLHGSGCVCGGTLNEVNVTAARLKDSGLRLSVESPATV